MAKMKGLQISSLLSLPIDAVTATQVVYGGKGIGKTNYGARIARLFGKSRNNPKYLHQTP